MACCCRSASASANARRARKHPFGHGKELYFWSLIVAEDSAALARLVIAGAGVWASHGLGRPELDGVASMLIGVLLAGVAVLLIHESRSLLVGEGIRPETARAIRALAGAQPAIRRAGHPLSMYVGRDAVLVTLDVEFEPGTAAHHVAAAIEQPEDQIRARFPLVMHIYVEAARQAGRSLGHASARD